MRNFTRLHSCSIQNRMPEGIEPDSYERLWSHHIIYYGTCLLSRKGREMCMVSFFSPWQTTRSGISRDYQLNSPNVVKQFHFRAAYQWCNLPAGPVQKTQGQRIWEKNAFEKKTSPVAYISNFQIIVIRKKRQYLTTKQKKLLNTVYRQAIAKTETFNNYSSSPNGLWVNSPWGRKSNGLLTQRPWGRGE